MKGHKNFVTSLLLSDDELTLFSGSYDYSIKKWDLNTKNCMKTIKTNGW